LIASAPRIRHTIQMSFLLAFVEDTTLLTSLKTQLLVAVPSLDDPHFTRSVALICQHGEHGAMGVIVNRALDLTLGEIFVQMGITSDDAALLTTPVLAGGPVHTERGFVIHDGEKTWESTLPIGNGLSVTTSRDVLEAIARGEGPPHAVVLLGCAGWGAGQLEQELAEHSWLATPFDSKVLFELPLDARWQAAAGGIGVDLMRMADYAGHA